MQSCGLTPRKWGTCQQSRPGTIQADHRCNVFAGTSFYVSYVPEVRFKENQLDTAGVA
jgi:hypothetical protein